MRSLRLAIATLLAVAACGCMDPVARERALARQRAAADTVLSLEKRERERPKNVRDDLLWAGQMIREDERTRLMNNRNYVQSWKNEVRRWQVRAPDYAREAGKVFAGDVKRAHDTSVQMID